MVVLIYFSFLSFLYIFFSHYWSIGIYTLHCSVAIIVVFVPYLTNKSYCLWVYIYDSGTTRNWCLQQSKAVESRFLLDFQVCVIMIVGGCWVLYVRTAIEGLKLCPPFIWKLVCCVTWNRMRVIDEMKVGWIVCNFLLFLWITFLFDLTFMECNDKRWREHWFWEKK